MFNSAMHFITLKLDLPSCANLGLSYLPYRYAEFVSNLLNFFVKEDYSYFEYVFSVFCFVLWRLQIYVHCGFEELYLFFELIKFVPIQSNPFWVFSYC